jgi:hypothetical protein
MPNDELLVNALVLSVKHDIKMGGKRDDIMKSLSSLVNEDLYSKLKDKI